MTQTISPNLPPPSFSDKRLVELDWLRVIVFGLLIFYHVGMLYAEGWGYHYKSTYSSKFLTNIMLWSNQWRMALLFLISGAAVSFLLAKQACWQFIRKRVPLLLLPLVFGMLVVVVPQVYVEADSKGWLTTPNFWSFWYAYLDQNSAEFANHKTIGAMQLTWNHLWFLPYILAYTLVMWAVYPLLFAASLSPIRQWLASKVSVWLVVVCPIAISYLLGFLLDERNPVTLNFVDDWFNHARSFLVFVIGFLLVRMPDVWQSLRNYRWQFLLVALLTYAYILFAHNGGSLGNSPSAKFVNGLFFTANGWFWILALIAWAQVCLTKSSPLLLYLNSGVYCFYVVHQTLIIVIAYFLVPKKLGPIIEPMLIALMVVIGCVTLYELIRRLPVIGVFFGVQRRK